MLKALPKEHLSVSQINCYMRCPAQYKFRYVDGLILPPKTPLTKGKSVHKGIEHNYSQKIETRQDVKLSEVQEVTAAEFESLRDETDFDKSDPGKVKDETVSLVTLYHNEIAPKVQPVAVEKEVVVEFENADYKLLGYIDVLDEEGFIRDTKTASKSPSEAEVNKSLQLTAYSMAHRTLFGTEEKGVKLDYLVQNKTPKVVQLEGRRTQRDIERFLKTMGIIAHAIRSGVFYPNENNYLCGHEKCGYWNICRKEF